VIGYPDTRRCGQTDVLHGERVDDPYRWLEDIDGRDATGWVAAQNELTERILARVRSRQEFRQRLAQLRALPAVGVPLQRGGQWFQTRNPGGLHEQPDVLYVACGPDEEGRVLLDPAELSADGSVAVSGLSVSPDGSRLAYATSRAGSDWLTWRVRDTASGEDLADVLDWSRLETAEWVTDGSGFYYTRAQPPAAGREYTQLAEAGSVYFHRTGTRQDRDELVFTPADAGQSTEIAMSADRKYLLVWLSRGLGSGHELRVLELAAPERGWRVLVPAGTARYLAAGSGDGVWYLVTDEGAQRRRVVAIDVAKPQPEHWREVVPESGDTLLEAHLFGGRLVCHYLRDVCSLLRVVRLDGTPERDIPVPPMSTLCGSIATHEAIEGTADGDVVHFQVESFTAGPSLWRHDLGTGETSLVRDSSFSLGAGYVTERVFVTSEDGTRVPLFLTRRRDLPRDGTARVLLCGYGGVRIAITPSFSATWAVWLERGGTLAVASVRGGGEYGSDWYDDGRLASKQHTFDDFCACARWLVSSGWSEPARIAISGESNGGLLVGACLTQQPELFGAVLANVGVFDMLRFHLFTVGRFWTTEYGDPENPAQFAWLRSYSPLHNVRRGGYPAVLLTTGDHDDRVVPCHSYKFAAALQAAQTNSAPVLLRVETAAGHGHGKPAGKQIAEAADGLAFLELALGPASQRLVGAAADGVQQPG
jgi:prolyl oligopeptidase